MIATKADTAASCSTGARPLASCSYIPATLQSPARLARQLRCSLPQRRVAQRLPHVCAELKASEGGRADPDDETTKKYGLEAGLFKVFTAKDSNGQSKAGQAKQLLARYGSAYLLTSISFALVSFGCCYAAVNAGVDVAALLSRFGLQVTDTSEKVGTLAIAYAAHKALSPVRFPPTVALTPVVARALGKDQGGQQEGGGEDGGDSK